jgi:hypothetical protein
MPIRSRISDSWRDSGFSVFPGRFSGVLLIVICILALLVSQTGNSSVPGSDPGFRLMAGCTAQSLEGNVSSVHTAVSQNQASNIANLSSNYSNAVQSMGSGVTVNFTAAGLWGSMSLSRCSYDFPDMMVGYALNSSYDTGQLSIYVNDTTGRVVNTNISWFPAGYGAEHGSTNQWSGYTADPCTACSIHGTYVQWQGSSLAVAHGHCGASFPYPSPSECIVSYWGGLSPTQTGVSGIAQSGINAVVVCWDFYGLSYYCGNIFTAWYEAYPSSPNNCFNFNSGSNLLSSEVSYIPSTATYWMTIWDQSSGQACSHSMSAYGPFVWNFGPPTYGQFITESDDNPLGGIADVPSYNVTFNSALALGDPTNFAPYSYPDLSFPGTILQYPMTYNQGACAGTGLDCFWDAS